MVGSRAHRGLGVLVACGALLAALAPAAEARLTFTRDDGSPIEFDQRPRVWCGPWEQGVRVRAVHVLAGRGRHHWQLDAVRRDVARGTTVRFPRFFVFDHPKGAQLFVADAPNEASTGEEEASGSMTFMRVTCRRGGVLAFRVDAVLGSEFSDLGTIRVQGTFRGRVGHPPRSPRSPR